MKSGNHLTGLLKYGVGGLLFLLFMYQVSQTERHDFGELLLWYTLAFCLFAGFCFVKANAVDWRIILGLALTARLIFFTTEPHLSDDYHRFLWDGHLVVHGVNPYAANPGELIREDTSDWLDTGLYQKLNSPEYHSVYPVVPQMIFAMGALTGGTDWEMNVLIQRVILLLFELGTILLLIRLSRRLGRSKNHWVFYALNPLVIAEISGNLHHEGIVCFFLLLAVSCWKKWKTWPSALALTGAIATKLIPVIFLPFFLKEHNYRKFLPFALITLLLSALLVLLPLFTSGEIGFFSSLGLYLSRFEFNAGLYHLVNGLASSLAGFNAIAFTGPVLRVCSILLLIWVFIRTKGNIQRHLPYDLVVVLTIFLAFSTTVHPWYIIPLIALCPLTPYRSPLLWSFLIILSYAAYSETVAVGESVVLAIQYVPVITLFVYELSRDARWRNAAVPEG